jgi:hypothetical protein
MNPSPKEHCVTSKPTTRNQPSTKSSSPSSTPFGTCTSTSPYQARSPKPLKRPGSSPLPKSQTSALLRKSKNGKISCWLARRKCWTRARSGRRGCGCGMGRGKKSRSSGATGFISCGPFWECLFGILRLLLPRQSCDSYPTPKRSLLWSLYILLYISNGASGTVGISALTLHSLCTSPSCFLSFPPSPSPPRLLSPNPPYPGARTPSHPTPSTTPRSS